MTSKRSKLLQQLVNVGLLIIVVGLLGWLSNRYKSEYDWTYGHRNTLSDASQQLLKTLPGPIHFYAFVYSNAADQRDSIKDGIGRYQRVKHDITLKFIDPSLDPQEVKKYNISQPGQLVVEYAGQHETLDKVSEPNVSDALERLSTKKHAFIAFLGGHGEHSIHDKDQNGYSDFAQALKDKGMRVLELNLAMQPQIPYNTSTLVIAAPKNDLLPAEKRVIERYVNFGGNLLWLADTDNPPYLNGVAKQLGITWQNGYAVFPNYRELGTGNPGIYLASKYPQDNPVTKGFKEITVFPLVRSLTFDRQSGWHQLPFLETSHDAWLEATQKQGAITFDPKDGDIPGPLTIGLAEKREVALPKEYVAARDKALAAAKAERQQMAAHNAPATSGSAPAPAASAAKPPPAHGEDKQQRIIAIGDADFLSNGNLKALGNRDLGVNLINWLASRDKALNISIPKAPDRQLYLPGWASWLITAGFIFVLPLLLVAFGVVRWALRRRR